MLLANKLSLVRVFFAPVFFAAYNAAQVFSGHRVTILMCLFAALVIVEFTDYLDGYYARKLKEVSDTGKLLDPFADALLHISVFFCLATQDVLPDFLFMLIFYREFCMLFLRMLAIKKGAAIAARVGGKLKTALYVSASFCAVALDIYADMFPGAALVSLRTALNVLFYLGAAAAYISFADYLFQFRKLLARR
jgi:CDP-diacylglycerol--glycerol-3-phosphate 3-phosphatidyltransferase